MTTENDEIVLSSDDLNAQEPGTSEFIHFEPDEVLTLGIGESIPENNIVFIAGESGAEEWFKVSNEGFFVKGKKVTGNYEIYRGFVEWLNASREGSGMEPISIEPPPAGAFKISLEEDGNRFKKIRELKHGSPKMNKKIEKLIMKYRRAGHKVIKEEIYLNNKKKIKIAVQLNMFGEKIEPGPVLA